MIVQIYKNKEEGRIILLNKSYQYKIKLCDGYEFEEEIEAEDWARCIKKTQVFLLNASVLNV